MVWPCAELTRSPNWTSRDKLGSTQFAYVDLKGNRESIQPGWRVVDANGEDVGTVIENDGSELTRIET